MRVCSFLLVFLSTTAFASDFEQRYFQSVFSGDLSWVADAEPKTPPEVQLKAKFDEQFILRIDESSIADIDDPLVNAIARRYLDYWREALLTPQEIDNAERRLLTDIARLLALEGRAPDLDDLDGTLSRLLAERGFSHRGGRTQPLLDFMLWRDTQTVEYGVELTDGHQNVIVHLLNDFVIRGWSHFATFGRSGTGGWADRDALYCVVDAYALDSESFENSYLRHEARHYADYERFPALKGADLEYRGKLTELAFSTDARLLLRRFWQDSNSTSVAPHPLSNWHVAQNMARTANASCREDTLQCLESVSNSDLQAAARTLLSNHTKQLVALGADTVMTTLEPEAPE